jgi:hypothetical protein
MLRIQPLEGRRLPHLERVGSIDMTDRTAPRHLEGHVRWPPMRYMILVHASPGSEAGAMPTEQQIAEQLAFHQAIDEAGILIDAMGFHPTSDAWRVQQRTDGSREVIEGPFHDEHLIAGYTLIDVASREEAMDWSLRYAKTATEDEDGEIEVRRLFDLDEFVQGPAVRGFRELDLVDFYGKAVILAARIAAEARGGEVLVSRLVRELTEGASLFSFTDPTDVELKGLSGMHSLSAVRWQTDLDQPLGDRNTSSGS